MRLIVSAFQFHSPILISLNIFLPLSKVSFSICALSFKHLFTANIFSRSYSAVRYYFNHRLSVLSIQFQPYECQAFFLI